MSDNERTTYRCASPPPGQKAVLKLRGRDHVVMLYDQSAGGITVEFAGRLKAKVGDVVRVRTCTGWTEATIVHRHVEDGTTRLGLERFGELPDPREPAWSLQPGKSRRSLGLLAAVLVVFLACQMMTADWFSGSAQPLKVYDFFSDLLGKGPRPTSGAIEIP